MSQKYHLHVRCGKAGGYDIFIGRGLESLPDAIADLDLGREAFMFSSPTVYPLHGRRTEETLLSGGVESDVHLLPDGEENKSFRYYNQALEALAQFDGGENKRFFVTNLGVGVLMDLAGFAAATFMRGMDFIQIPTTLLGAVDCSVGGKVGINFRGVKNYLGTFYQPRLVWIDFSMLETLDRRQLRSGFAEIVKYGTAFDSNLFSYLEKHAEEILALDEDALQHVVRASCQIKLKIVEEDEKEQSGIRSLLNFGHTIGHAIEAASSYAYTHGEAISVGMCAALDLARELGILKGNVLTRVENLLEQVGLPTNVENCSVDSVLSFLSRDKKFINGRNRFALVSKIGHSEMCEDIDPRIVRSVVENRVLPTCSKSAVSI